MSTGRRRPVGARCKPIRMESPALRRAFLWADARLRPRFRQDEEKDNTRYVLNAILAALPGFFGPKSHCCKYITVGLKKQIRAYSLALRDNLETIRKQKSATRRQLDPVSPRHCRRRA
ncbi:MAG: hypothetical protein WAK03_03525 [Methylocystis sp.]